MTDMVLISEIKIDRDLREGDDLSDLKPEDLAKPIVVTTDGRLIDGLRRIRLLEKMGVPNVPAYQVDTLEEAAEALAEQHPTQLRDWQRVAEIMPFLRAFGERRWLKIRQASIAHNAHGKTMPADRPQGPARIYLQKAFGGLSPAHYEVAERVLGDDYPEELKEEVRSGRISPSGAVNRMHRRGLSGHVTAPAEQEMLIHTTAQSIRSAAMNLEQLGPIRVEATRVKELREHLFKSRTMITTFLNQLEEAVK
jgi:hypothetical protein